MSFIGSLSVTNYNRPYIEDALDHNFINYITDKNICNSRIFHFGTGNHHHVGKSTKQVNCNNSVLAVTASPEEFLTYITLIKEDKELARSYQVLYGDIYNMNLSFYHDFDLVYLPHICEYSHDSANEYRKDFVLISGFLDILRNGGKIILNKNSNHFNYAQYVINKLLLDMHIDIEFDYMYNNLIVLKKGRSIHCIMSVINYNKYLDNLCFAKKDSILTILESCRFYKNQKQYYSNNIYTNGVIVINNIPKNSEENLMIVAHPDDEAIFGGFDLLTSKKWLVVYCTNDNTRIDMIKNISRAWSFNAIIMNSVDSPIKEYRFDMEILKSLHGIITQKRWNILVTHNSKGEYNHNQHILIHKLVTYILYNSLADKRPHIIKYFTPCRVLEDKYKHEILRSVHKYYKRQNWDNMIGSFKGCEINFFAEISHHNDLIYKLSEFLYSS